MGVSPYVNRLYVELQDGVILFQLYDIIKPGTVEWKRVIKSFSKLKVTFEKIGKFSNSYVTIIRCMLFTIA